MTIIEETHPPPPRLSSPGARVFGRFCDLMTKAAEAVVALAMAAIVLITLTAVWWRYVLDAPLSWIEQVSNMLFVWIVFIGAAILYRQQLHIAVDMFINMLPKATRDIAYWCIEGANLLFILVLFYFSLKLSIDVLPNTTGALDITPAWFYFSAPVACAMMVIYFIEKVLDPSKRVPSGVAGDF